MKKTPYAPHLLTEIIEGQSLRTLYQPIVCLRQQEIFGYEALMRGPEDSPWESPLTLLSAASEAGLLCDLELCCRNLSISRASELGLRGKLFLNVVPDCFQDDSFAHERILEFLDAAGIKPDRIVIEITEQYPLRDIGVARRIVERYRRHGVEIALDDLGAGYAGLRVWSELRPDYVKVDRHFVSDVHIDAAKRQFIHSMCEIAHILDCKLVAEGVEQEEELHTLQTLGVHYVQGYFIARPSARPPVWLEQLQTVLSRSRSHFHQHSKSVASLVRHQPAVAPDTPLEEAFELFRAQRYLSSLPVVDEGRPLGILLRSELLTLYTGRYGRELYGRKPVVRFMRSEPLIVDSQTLVEDLSQQITAQTAAWPEEDFIIVDHSGRYLGIGTLLDLLKTITDLQIRNARYANPLTQLPGNVPISEHVDELLTAQESFVVVYCDIDNFKPYNDKYGYARGDDVIKNVARLWNDYLDPVRDFIGHIGGDDFIIILRGDDWESQCRALLEAFEVMAPRCYDEQDCRRGGIYAQDRRGREQFFPFLSLTLAAVLARPDVHTSHHDIATLASEVKSRAKRVPGNILFLDRRRPASDDGALETAAGTAP
ncbi:MAG: GGDEF domain-containing protein [Gammaproteobacteria bacterium]|nr:GGDEF domain-containing protein [Gammaproteobacteria bacterium]